MKKSILKYKIKNRYLIYFIIAGYLMGIPLGLYANNVSAIGSYWYFDDLENTTIGLSNFNLINSTIAFADVDSLPSNRADPETDWQTYNHSGDMTYRLDASPSVDTTYYSDITFSYDIDKLTFESKISSWLPDRGSSGNFYTFYDSLGVVIFYARFYNIGGSTRVYLSANGTSSYKDYSNQNDKIYINNISILSNGTLMYHLKGDTAIDKKLYIEDPGFTSFNKMKITVNGYSDTGLDRYWYFDDFKVWTEESDNINPNVVGCYDESDGYTISGSYDIEHPYTHGISDKPVLEQKYDIPITTTIRGIDLVVASYQFTEISSNLNDYYLRINGFYCSNPDSYTYLTGDKYIMSWCGLSVPISNDKIVFEFTSQKYATDWTGHNGAYWDFGILYFDSDLDGGYNFGIGDLLADGVWNPSIFNIYRSLGSELAYKFYYDPIITTNIPEYNFNLITSFSNKVLTNETIQIQYFLNNSLGGSVNIYKVGTGYVSLGLNYPKSVYDSFGELSLFFNQTGTYRLVLKNYGGINVSTFNITVTQNNNNYYIYSYPNPSKQGEKVTFYYKYYNTYGFNGLILLGDNTEMSNSSQNHVYQRIILQSNTTGSFTYTFNYPTVTYYANMYMLVNNQYSFLLQYTHYLESPNSKFSLSLDNEGYVLFSTTKYYYLTVNYLNAYQCEGINIYHDGKLIKSNTGLTSGGRFTANITNPKAGIHNITMVLTTPSGQILLTYLNYPVTINEYPEETEQPLFFIQAPYSYFAGTFIIILLTLTPIIFGYMFKMNLSSIPQFLYLVFALLGFIISLLLGFFPMWSIIVLIIVGALIVVIMWLQRKQL